MARTKKDYIRELREVAQDNIWKCELILKRVSDSTDATDMEKRNNAKMNIEKDTEYIAFLDAELALCESSE